MKMLLKILAGFMGLVLVLVLVGFLLPRKYRVQRSLHIQTASETVYLAVSDLRRWKAWGEWYRKDPGMIVRYSEKTDEVGGWSEWVSEGHRGKMTLTHLQPPSQISYQLELPDDGMSASGAVEIVGDGAGVSVTMIMEGNLGNNPVKRWFGLFMDAMIGPDFEAGLVNLKTLSEKGRSS